MKLGVIRLQADISQVFKGAVSPLPIAQIESDVQPEKTDLVCRPTIIEDGKIAEYTMPITEGNIRRVVKSYLLKRGWSVFYELCYIPQNPFPSDVQSDWKARDDEAFARESEYFNKTTAMLKHLEYLESQVKERMQLHKSWFVMQQALHGQDKVPNPGVWESVSYPFEYKLKVLKQQKIQIKRASFGEALPEAPSLADLPQTATSAESVLVKEEKRGRDGYTPSEREAKKLELETEGKKIGIDLDRKKSVANMLKDLEEYKKTK